ncbi:DUF1421 multi-domain protein [Pyrenophora tritici-repentis]|uniref:DUF1421 multi-domain protein n=2 Tax=Pyrenophora tritici-repentis TaxID=45151 RepID=A0A834VM90_9PLEO|nr:DUF1421 multi-domain protein [Pyrenophora tritici-repentis]KAF7573342.1 DUF1421 multi-domain protein [Pyrenophora tritici-repentis]
MAGSQSNSGDTDADVQEQLLNYPSERNTSKRAETISPGAKFTAEHLMRHCPYTVTFDYINPSLWGVPAPEDADETHATTWVAKAIHDYHVGMEWDERLYFDYQWDFEGWTRELFQKVERTTLRSLKTVLRYRGVYTGKFRARVADSLFNLLGGENAPEWDPAEFKAEKFDERSEAYQRQQNAHLAAPIDRQAQQPLQQTQPLEPLQPQPQRPSQGEQYRVRQGVRSHPQYQELQQPPYAINAYAGPQPRQTEQAMQPQQWYPQTQTRPQRPHTARPLGLPHDPYKTLPPRWSRNDRLEANTITQFSKLWDNSNKYTGNAYDLLDDKIKIFFSICWQVDIQEEQFHAVFPRILTGRAETFYIQVVERDDSFADAYMAIKNHFDHDVHHQHYYTDWTTTTFARTRAENPDKGLHEVLQILLDKLQLCQRALGKNFEGEDALRTTVINACRGVPELEMALFKPATICEGLFSDLRSAVETHLARQHTAQLVTEDQYYLDRRYNGNGRIRGGSRGGGGFRGGSRGAYRGGEQRDDNGRGFKPRWRKKCFVCRKEGCWSTNHTDKERKDARAQFFSTLYFTGAQPPEDFSVHLAEYEGIEHTSQYNQRGWREEEDCEDDEDDDVAEAHSEHQFFKEQCLADQAFLHHISGDDIYSRDAPSAPASQFLLEDRYTRSVYQGILPDTGAANVSTVGKEQYLALTREDPTVKLDTSTAGKASIKFGKGEATASIGTVQVSTEIGKINFEVLEAPTPFLLCLADMDRLKVYFNNTTDELVQDDVHIPVIRKWGHPWFHLNKRERATMFLTETELRRLHRRFGHPAVTRLVKLLKDAGHNDFEERTLEEVTKFCHHCQLHSSAPRRFKFTLKDDHHFNYEILVDVMYLSNKPVLHVVDSSTAFQGARFLSAISAKETWQALRILWIDTYQGPPDIITHDAGTNFASAEFRAEAKIMGVTCKQVPTEAHWSIGKTERYHAPLRRAWDILHAELTDTMSDDAILQMAVKAVNDTAGPDGLVPTLLVFGAYPRMTAESPPSPSMVKRSEAIQKATKALRKLTAERQVADALNTRNGPATADMLALPLQSEVLVWRESDGWNGPYKIASTDGHNITVDMVNGPATFRSTVVKPYYRPDHLWSDPDAPHAPNEPNEPHEPIAVPPAAQPRRRGRPPGSKNKRKAHAYITKKEQDDLELAIKLRNDGVITTSGAPFEASDDQEISDLVGRGVFKFEQYDERLHSKIRIFKSRLVREVKGKTTKPYEKSRLVIQGYQDYGKEAILTQSPTIQRCSQRLIMSLAPGLVQSGMSVELRDITQAYPQAQTTLKRTILAHLPTELVHRYPEGTILHVIKPLYGIAEAGVHWWTTYHGHHCKELDMSTSTYDPCLLITNSDDADVFGIVGMQTDDTLMLGTTAFLSREEKKIQKAQFRSKPKAMLTPEVQLDFNGCTLTMDASRVLILRQKGQGGRIRLVDIRAPDRAQQYTEQRARGAYIASTCQPEASFDLSVAAQAQQPSDEDIKALNKRLKWQMENLTRGLRYVTVNLTEAKLIVFVDGSFANNKDLSSQLGFVLMLVNESIGANTFTIQGNVIHYSSTKCKRITRSVLASEIYGMVNGFDIGIAVATTLRIVTERLGLPAIPLVICTDSYSLYECLVKLGTTKEKRLMIDIMALRQSYERREITEIRWINGEDNPADAFTKASPNRALERFIDGNKLTVRVDGWVQRPTSFDV